MDAKTTERIILRNRLLHALITRRVARARQRAGIADELAALRARHQSRTEGAQRG